MKTRNKRNRMLSLLCVFAMVAGILNPAAFGMADDAFAASAIEISTPEELQKIGQDAAYPLSGDYVLTEDLDMTGIPFTPIGGTHGDKGTVNGSNVFSGTFDGQGHLISNLSISITENVGDYAQIGMFSVIASDDAADYAKVSNLAFANVSIATEISGGMTTAGTLAGEVNGYAQVENIAVLDGSVTINTFNRSDVVGAAGVIGECRTAAAMGNQNIVIRNIYNGATVLVGSSTDINFVSGIIGRVSVTTCKEISGCVNTGNTSFKGDLGMGIATFNNVDNSCLKNSYFLFDTGRASASTELEEDTLKNGTLPAGLDPAAWFAEKGQFPLPMFCSEGGPEGYLGLLGLELEFADGDTALSVTQDIVLPMAAGDTAVTWESSNTDVITIEGSTAVVSGVLSPVKVVLTASTADGKTRKFTVTVVSNVNAQFEQDYAKAGSPLSVAVTNAPEGMKFTYTWSVGGQVLKNVTGNTYTPTEADKEKFIEADVKAADGSAEWNVITYMSDFPVVYINTEDSRDVTTQQYKDANLRIQGNDTFQSSSVLYNGLTEIKGRGNSTWDYALGNGLKKPFKLKLDKKTDVFGMGKNKHWVLLANMIDHTNMRNQLMYEFADDIGMECFMDTEPVILIMNGEYVGFYELCEHKRIDDYRVEVFDWEGLGEDIAGAIADGAGLSKGDTSDLEEQMTVDFSWVDNGKVTFNGKTYTVSDYYTDEIPEYTGGFLMDMDFRIDDSKNISKFRLNSGYPMIFESPEYAKTSTTMMNYTKNYLQAFEDAIHDDDYYVNYDGKEMYYGDLYDIDSLIQNWFLVEYSMNWDAMKNSTLMYKDLNGKLTMGPAWDFDWCWGNINMYSMTGPYVIEGWHTTQDSFCEQQYQYENWNRYLVSDPYFMTLAYEKWQEIRPTIIEDMIKEGGKIDTMEEDYRVASEANDARWSYSYGMYKGMGITNGQPVYKQSELYDDAVTSMKYFITNRIAWMDKQFTSLDNLLTSLGRYKGSDAIQVKDVEFLPEAKSKITATVSNPNAAKIAFYVNGIRAGEADVQNAAASITVDDAMLRTGENMTNTVQVRALDKSGAFVKNGSNVLTNYKNFVKSSVPGPADKTALEAAVAAAGELAEADYTEATWAKFAEALAAAQAVLDRADAAQNEINTAAATLVAAQNALVKKGEEPVIPEVLADFKFDADGDFFDGGNAKATGTYTLEDHDSGKALKLGGNGQHLVVTDKAGNSLLTGVKEMTVSYQIKPESSATNWGFFAAPNADEQKYQEEHYIGIADINGTTKAERYNNSGTRPETAGHATGYNGWYYVTVVYTEGNTELYIDGVKVAEAASDYALADILGDSSVLYIGKSTWTANQEYATALFDNYKIVSRALTAEEVAKEAAKYAGTYVEKDALAEAIEKAVPADDKDKYTEESWKAYETALAKAKEVYEDADAAQDEVDAAVKALTDAQGALEEKAGLPYVDITEEHWGYNAVAYNYFAGTMTGKDETHFAPDDPLKRAQFAAVLYKMNKSPAVEFEETFPDVPAEAWCADCVTWALNQEIVTGYTDTNTFKPDNDVTRAELATMLYRYAKNFKKYDVSTEGDYSTFPDAKDVQEFAEDAMSWAVGEGIITGKTIDEQLMLYPNGTANRAECATIIQRYMELYEK